MAIIRRFTTKRQSKTVATRLPAELHDKLVLKHPERTEISRVLRALVQSYLNGEIKELKYVSVDVI